MNPIKLLDFVSLPLVSLPFMPNFGFPMMLGVYMAWSVMLYVLARRTKHKESAILAFVPILNFGLLFKIARFSPWLAATLFIPGVNVVMLGWSYARIVKDAKKPWWWVPLMFVNPVHLVLMGILANTYEEKQQASLPDGISFESPFQPELDPFTQKATVMD
jgi:hypothetical protein